MRTKTRSLFRPRVRGILGLLIEKTVNSTEKARKSFDFGSDLTKSENYDCLAPNLLTCSIASWKKTPYWRFVRRTDLPIGVKR